MAKTRSCRAFNDAFSRQRKLEAQKLSPAHSLGVTLYNFMNGSRKVVNVADDRKVTRVMVADR